MTKNEAALRVSSAVAAALIFYLIIEFFAKDFSVPWKILIVGTALVVALLVAFWSGQKKGDSQSAQTKIGSDITSKGSVSLDGVTVQTESGKDTHVGTNVSAEKDVAIKNVTVGRQDNSK